MVTKMHAAWDKLEFILNQYTPFVYFSHAQNRLYWGYLLAALVLATAYSLWQLHRQQQLNRQAIGNLARALWHHLCSRQARLDYQFLIINTLIKVLLIAPWILSANSVAKWLLKSQMPDSLFALRGELASLSHSQVALIYTVVLFILSDLSRYALHRLMHSVPILWEFHKVHHSATRLNPTTFYRVHPVENILFGLRYALVAGSVTGVFIALFGAKLSVLDIAGVNAFLYVFNVIGSNLRHSHVYLRYPRALEFIFISPAQHQLHHQYRTSMSNYGSTLAIWDWLFNSLINSADTPKPLRFGLGRSENKDYFHIKGLLLLPFKKIFLQVCAAITRGSHHVFSKIQQFKI